ncbi:MAG: threonine aldolase family protein, partial [Promethearchaeota archaeon]
TLTDLATTPEKLGDDVEQEDPTVNALEAKAAALVGKDAALFVTSGTQGNLLSMLSQTHPGDEILVEEHSHIYKWEVGGAARLGGLVMRTFPSQKGLFNPNDLQPLIRPHDDIHQPITTMITLENTHNYHGGIALPPSLFAQVHEFATKNELKVHVDGARIFNAAVARDIPVMEYTKHVDSVQFCLSKGLACPIGSIIAGTREFIETARKYRKMVGGGWRQAGILASMGLVALEDKWITRLKEDHNLATYLAKGLLEGAQNSLPITIPLPETNLLMIEIPSTTEIEPLITALNEMGIQSHSMGHRIRLVTHYEFTKEDMEYSMPIILEVLKKHLG